MDQDLINAIRIVVKEEITEQLIPIKEQLKDLAPMKEQLKELEPMKEQLKELPSIKEQLTHMQHQLDRMEYSQTHDVLSLLTMIDTKLEQTATKEDIAYLARRIGEHDLELDRLKRIK
ncbi:hypothetical protein [Paenibacillus periandrae]|uniref:hypothetical protein n=1 Tax=Paenibacillus periandrae TaxID=1761741 RepID=UPI001F09E2B3|nr:hypothetical protein [Paenibacillus periandrae]